MVLATLNLVSGGLMLYSGLEALRPPRSPNALSASLDPQINDELRQQLASALVSISTAHAGRLRAMGIASIAMGLLFSYATVAAVTRDRNGRAAMILAASVALPYHAITAWVSEPIARQQAEAAAPILERIVADIPASPSIGADDRRMQDELAARAAAAFIRAAPVGMALAGGAYSLLLLSYFAGKRGRRLYGLESSPTDGG